MHELLSNVIIQVPPQTYLKDPESSKLGKKIIAESIELLHEIGFELFTFRKLAVRIGSTEASVYRYFEGKHKLLLYLISWYWGWMEYRLVFALANIDSPVVRLEKAIEMLTAAVEEDYDFSHINESKLYQIVISESSKAYLTREVDEENKIGLFRGYKTLVARVVQIIQEINPDYPYPHILISTIIEGAYKQRFFADHLPGLTNVSEEKDTIVSCYKELVIGAIHV
jgi:AcrR family transcriptional regulator